MISPAARRFTLFALPLMIMLAVVLLAPNGRGDSPPPASGDWWVTQDTSVSDTTVVVTGALHVLNSSSLSLTNVTLLFDAPGSPAALISIDSSCSLLMYNSRIDRASASTQITGLVAGFVRAWNSTFANITGGANTSEPGLVVAGGFVGAQGGAVVDSAVAFTVRAGGVSLNWMQSTNVSTSVILIRNNSTGPAYAAFHNGSATTTRELVAAACDPCSGDIWVWIRNVQFISGAAGGTAAVRLLGPSAASLNITIEGLTVTAPNYRALDLELGSVGSTTLSLNADVTSASAGPFYTVWVDSGTGPIRATLDGAAGTYISLSEMRVNRSSSDIEARVLNSSVEDLWFLLNSSTRVTFQARQSAFGQTVSGGLQLITLGPVTAIVDRCTFGNDATGFGGLNVDFRNGGSLEVSNSTFTRGGLSMGRAALGNPGQVSMWVHDVALLNNSTIFVFAIGSPARFGDVLIENISVSESARSVLSINAAVAMNFTVRDVAARGDLTGIAVLMDVTAGFNGTFERCRFTGFATGMRFNRPLVTNFPGALRLDRVVLNGSVWGLRHEGNGTAHITFPTWISNSWIGSNTTALAVYNARVYVENSTLWRGTGGLAIWGVESQIYLYNTEHDTVGVLNDARFYNQDTIESWWHAPTLVVWKEGGEVATGWNITLNRRVGGLFVNGTVLPDGRIDNAPADLLQYRFGLDTNLDLDGRNLTGYLSFPGRANVPATPTMTGNLSVFRIEVHDSNSPSVELISPPPPPAVNSTAFSITARFYDPESGVSGADATVVFESFSPFVGATGHLWEGSTELSVIIKGDFTLEIRARDLAGNEGLLTLALNVDRTFPFLYASGPPEGAHLNVTAFNFTASTDDDVEAVTIGGVDAAQNVSGGFSAYALWTAWITLEEGDHPVRVTLTDRAGNTAVFFVNLTIDLTPPSPVITGITDGAFVNTTSLPITVETYPTDSVFVDGQRVAGSSSPFHANITAVSGTSNHTIVVRDLAGNAANFRYELTLDRNPPTLHFAGADPGGNFTLRSTAVDFYLVASLDTVRVTDGTTAWPMDSLGNVHIALTLAEGSHPVRIVATDRAGNTGVLSVTIIVDLTPPTLAATTPTNGSRVNHPRLGLIVELSEEGQVGYGAGRYLPASGLITVPLDLREGQNDIVLTLFDVAGNSADVHVMIVGDFTPPSVRIDAPANHSVRPVGAFHLTGTVEPGANVTVNGVPVTVAANGTFEANVSLEAGHRTVLVLVTDQAGNQALVILDLDGTPPADFVPIAAGSFAAVAALAILSLLWRRRSPPEG